MRVGVFCLREDIISSIFMSCLGIAARVPRSMRRMSTLPLACWRSGVPAAEAARVLAGRLGCSAAAGAPLRQPGRRVGPGPGSRAGHGVHRPAAGQAGGGVREHARASGRTISAVVAQALEEFLAAGSPEPSPQVNGRQVEAEFVFDRHAATDLSVAYAILVPQRRARIARRRPGRTAR